MRATINIRDDIYQIIRHIAEQQSTSVGEVVSKLLEQCLYFPVGIAEANANQAVLLTLDRSIQTACSWPEVVEEL